MRILFLHPKAWTGEHALLSELVRLGHDVCVLEERRGGPTRQYLPWHLGPKDRVRTLWYNPSRGAMRLATWLFDRIFRKAFDGRNLVHRILVIREAVGFFEPEAIMASDGFSYAIPAALGKRLGLISRRLVVSYIGGDVLDCPEADVGHRRTPLTDWMIRASFAGIDVLRPVSPKIESVLLEDGAPDERIRMIPSHLVADRATLSKIASRRGEIRTSFRQQHALPEDAPLIITLSGNHKGKGLHVLARAWPSVVAAIPGVRWLLCGPSHPWLIAEVLPILERAGVRDSVVLSGRLEGQEVFRHLAAADLHVNPSLCESLNMVTVEAAAVGTPTIGSDGAGIAYWISRFDAGLVVPRQEAAPLGDAIICALKDCDRMRAWSRALPALAEEFSLERIAASLIPLLRGELEQSRTAPGARP